MLDEKDKIIISNLMIDCKITTSKLAKITKLSQSSVVYRIKKLENEKYILRYDTLINYNKFKLNSANILATIPKNHKKDFENTCNKNKGIISLFETISKYNYIITTFATEIELKRIINYLKRNNFQFVHLQNQKTYCLPISIYDINLNYKKTKSINKSLNLDKIDLSILRVLSSGNAKISMPKLAEKIGTTIDIALYRYRQLKKHGYFSLNLAQINLKKFHINYNCIFLKTKDIDFKEAKKRLFNLKRIVWFGKIDENTYFITIASKNYQDYSNLLNKIYNSFISKIVFLELILMKDWLFLNRINFDKILSEEK